LEEPVRQRDLVTSIEVFAKKNGPFDFIASLSYADPFAAPFATG
jgi:hypothetical protein